MKQIIQTDDSLRELCIHGTPDFPLQINHDSIDDFQDNYIRCHWHGELEISIVTEAGYCTSPAALPTGWKQDTA